MHDAFGRLRDMTREWKLGVIAVKLDIRGAFDHVHRRAVADFVEGRLTNEGVPYELRFLLRLLDVNRLEGCAPGGTAISVESNRGIRQGSPESAEIFGLLIASIVTELKNGEAWRRPSGDMLDVPADVGCYQDDIFLWGEQAGPVAHNVALISAALRKVGLQLAGEKTAVVASKYYKGVRHICVDGVRVEFQPKGTSIRVLILMLLHISKRSKGADCFPCQQSPAMWSGFAGHEGLLRSHACRRVLELDCGLASLGEG